VEGAQAVLLAERRIRTDKEREWVEGLVSELAARRRDAGYRQ
jgi:hypothetical protein